MTDRVLTDEEVAAIEASAETATVRRLCASHFLLQQRVEALKAMGIGMLEESKRARCDD